MKNKNSYIKGFTLIELLVVVLIIGILAAVALPQYQKAVTKSRFAEALANLRTIYNARKVCELEKGERNCSFDDLAIDMPGDWRDDGFGASYCAGYATEHFIYGDMCGEQRKATAGYKDEDVCVCMDENGFSILQNDSCAHKRTSFDYSKLLNIPEADINNASCYCC
jgi:prepilin-type N-terminal cleavage/methylation domain-containing protein